MRAWWIVALAGAFAAVMSEDTGEDMARPQTTLEVVVGAFERTTAARPSRLASSIGGWALEYALRGRLDLTRGYRFCGRAAIDGEIPRATALWVAADRGSLAGKNRTYDHVAQFSDATRTRPLTWRRALRCKRSGWVDDHPPTLPVTATNRSTAFDVGAESYVHLALLALTRTEEGTVSATMLRGAHGRYRIVFAYRRFDRRPPVEDDDAREIRRLLRAAGELPIDVSIDSAGYVRRLGLAAPRPTGPDSVAKAPITVELKLSAIGHEQPVPLATVNAIE